MTTITGSIKFFNTDKNFGFITADGLDHFVNLKSIEAAGFDLSAMITGAVVEFVSAEADDGKRRVM